MFQLQTQQNGDTTGSNAMAEIKARGTDHPPYPSDAQSADTVTLTMTPTPLVTMI